MGNKQKLLIALPVFALLGLLAVRMNAEVRTNTYFAIERGWKQYWPMKHGAWMFLRFRPLFEPFVPVRVEVEPNVSLKLDPDDLLMLGILENGTWEPDSINILKQHVKAGGTVVDVGAHIGYYSLMAAQIVGPNGHVLAVEPNPETLIDLKDNLRESGVSNVSVQPFACSDSEATLELFAAGRSNTGESSLSHENASQAGSIHASYKVRARPLDAIVAESGVNTVDAIKIDVEGAELLVLKGAQQTLARYSPVLIIELIDKQLKSMGTSVAEVTEFLHAQGYEPESKEGANGVFIKKK